MRRSSLRLRHSDTVFVRRTMPHAKRICHYRHKGTLPSGIPLDPGACSLDTLRRMRRCSRRVRRIRSTNWCNGHSNGTGTCRQGIAWSRHCTIRSNLSYACNRIACPYCNACSDPLIGIACHVHSSGRAKWLLLQAQHAFEFLQEWNGLDSCNRRNSRRRLTVVLQCLV